MIILQAKLLKFRFQIFAAETEFTNVRLAQQAKCGTR